MNKNQSIIALGIRLAIGVSLCNVILISVVGCNESRTNVEAKVSDTLKPPKVADTPDNSTVSAIHNAEIFYGEDTIKITLRRDSASVNKLVFVVNLKEKKFEGLANLVLIEDGGEYYLPESTPRLDEKTNEEYACDSTFSYQSKQISFAFAMENKTHKRLSFVISNSAIETLDDSYLTLYRQE